MRRLYSLTALISLVALTAGCGQVDPVVLTVSMPDCVYQGPMAMQAGSARLTLTLHGVTDSGVSLTSLRGDRDADDLKTYLTSVSALWEDRPAWAQPVVELRLDTARALDGVSKETHLDRGRYAVVCLERVDDTLIAEIASPLSVSH